MQVGWDESTAGERQEFPYEKLNHLQHPMYPSPFPLRLKRPWPTGVPSFHGIKDDDLGMNSPLMWMRGDGDRGMHNYTCTDFSLNPAMTPSSCIDESGFLQSPENVGQVNPPTRTFKAFQFSVLNGRRWKILICICQWGWDLK